MSVILNYWCYLHLAISTLVAHAESRITLACPFKHDKNSKNIAYYEINRLVSRDISICVKTDIWFIGYVSCKNAPKY